MAEQVIKMDGLREGQEQIHKAVDKFQGHCAVTSKEVFDRLRIVEAHQAKRLGRECQQKDEYTRHDLEIQKGQKFYIIAGAVICAVCSLLAGFGAAIISLIYMRP